VAVIQIALKKYIHAELVSVIIQDKEVLGMGKPMNMNRRIKKLEQNAKKISDNINRKSGSRAILPPNKAHGSDKYVRENNEVEVLSHGNHVDPDDYTDWE
jgi:hypothetical protein